MNRTLKPTRRTKQDSALYGYIEGALEKSDLMEIFFNRMCEEEKTWWRKRMNLDLKLEKATNDTVIDKIEADIEKHNNSYCW